MKTIVTSFAIVAALLVSGCGDTDSKSNQPDDKALNAASRAVLDATRGTLMSLKVYQALLKSIDRNLATSELQKQIDEVRSSFPISESELLKEMDQFSLLCERTATSEQLATLGSLRMRLSSHLEVLKKTRLVRSSSIVRDARLIEELLPSSIDILLTGISEAIEVISAIAEIIEAIPAPLPPDIMPPGDPWGGGRAFGPSNCPTIRNKYPNGWVPEGPFTPCEHFAQLRTCMKSEKEKACEQRCDPNNPPPGEVCNLMPARGEVEEIRCENPPAEYVALCAAAGNSRAVCTGNATNSFPVGFFVCKNPSSFKINICDSLKEVAGAALKSAAVGVTEVCPLPTR